MLSSLHDGSNSKFEAFILFIGKTGAGKSTLINLIAGEPIADTKSETTDIQEYQCTYQDEDTNRTWKLHLFDTPGSGDKRILNDTLDHFNAMACKRDTISGIIYCHNINQDQSTSLPSESIRILQKLPVVQAMKNVILCTTHWDVLVDVNVGECRAKELDKCHGDDVLRLSGRLARHDNTRKSIEEILRLIIGEAAVKVLLVAELGSLEVKQNHEKTKRLTQEIRSMQIQEVANRADISRRSEEYRWQRKIAHMCTELDEVEAAQEKEAIEREIGREIEDQEWKRRMWEAIQRTRQEIIEKATPVLCGSLAVAPSVKFLVSDVKLLERTLSGDGVKKKQVNSSMGSKTAIGTNNSHVKNRVLDNMSSYDFVPLQFKPFASEYSRYAISPELASRKIERVSPLLDALNEIFDTNIPISYPGIQKTLKYLINERHDLGAVYARLQVIWPKLGVPLVSPEPFANDSSDYVIGSPELAARKCQDVDELLSFLNMSFDTEIPRSKPGVEEVLRFLANQGCKFGDICAHMRYTWPSTPNLEREWLNVWKLERMKLQVWEDFLTLERRGKEHEDQRQSSLYNDTIKYVALIKPRRIWDLYAHRVIPFQFSSVDANSNYIDKSFKSSVPARSYLRFGPTRVARYHPVSHSWTDDMSPMDTPVNAREWPVPLPRRVTLEAVRNELLNLGAQYVWLDVVCLRQESPDSNREALRMKEWKFDVPMIGKVYESSPSVDSVIRYLNGLGKSFRRHGWNDKRHWSQRAWTLQEVSGTYIEAGLPKGVKDLLKETDEKGTRLRDHLKRSEIIFGFQSGLNRIGIDLHDAISAMKGRHSQNPVDKVFGLSALLECSSLITYSKDEEAEQAWARLLMHTNRRVLTELLFACPLPGENGCYWRPSWRQLMEDTGVIEKVPSLQALDSESVKVDEGRLRCSLAVIKGCRVSSDYHSVNTVLIKTERGKKKYEWTMIKPRTQDIVPGEYMLVGSYDRSVLCKPYPSRKLEKVSVLLRSPDEPHGDTDLHSRYWSDLMLIEDVVFC